MAERDWSRDPRLAMCGGLIRLPDNNVRLVCDPWLQPGIMSIETRDERRGGATTTTTTMASSSSGVGMIAATSFVVRRRQRREGEEGGRRKHNDPIAVRRSKMISTN